LKRICVFCGSSRGAKPEYADVADALGVAIAQRGYGLVYGGAQVGLMGIVADAALRAGGEVIGVIPEALVRKEVVHTHLQDLRIVGSMHERKALMSDLSDAFVALPGGCGTFEEFFEVVTWAQIGLHRKPCALLNVAGFYDPLLALFDHAVSERFVRPEHRAMIVTETDPERLLDLLETHQMPTLTKWIDRNET